MKLAKLIVVGLALVSGMVNAEVTVINSGNKDRKSVV